MQPPREVAGWTTDACRRRDSRTRMSSKMSTGGRVADGRLSAATPNVRQDADQRQVPSLEEERRPRAAANEPFGRSALRHRCTNDGTYYLGEHGHQLTRSSASVGAVWLLMGYFIVC